MIPTWLQNLLQQQVFGNTLEAYAGAALVFMAVLIGAPLVKTLVAARLKRLAKRTATDVDDFAVALLDEIGPFTYGVIALYFGLRSLTLAPSIDALLHLLFVVVLTTKVVQYLIETTTFFLAKWAARTEETDPTTAIAVKNMAAVARVVLWLGGVIFVLDNLGINVTAVIAGLGIGGVAVALAAQAILGDAFSSFAIFLDKPFAMNDFIVIDDLMGTVEHIGFKTTRIRSVDGEQLIIPNSHLTNSRLRNFKRMETRRVTFQLGVVYQTTVEQLRRIPTLVEALVKEQPLATFDRCHFFSYGDSALVFEIVFFVGSADYNTCMAVRQAINLRLKEEFEKLKVEFAHAPKPLYLAGLEAAHGK